MEKISTKELIKNAFLALLKPHKAFREIPKEGKLDYKKIIPLTFIWGAIFIILSFAFAQRTLIFQWNHWKFTLIFQAIYSFLLWFGGSILFFLLAKIFRKRVNLDRIEIGVFYIWIVWAIMPFFDLPHLLFKIPMWTIWGRGAHISWFITFPIFSILTFFFLKDILNFKNKEVTFTGVFSLFLPFVGRFILEDIPIFLDRILKLFFKKPAGFVSCALFANIFCLLLAIFLKLAFEKRIPFKNFIFGLVLLSFCFFSFWIWMTYFTSLFNFPTGGKTFSTIFFHKTNDFVKGRSRWTASYTWTSSDKESGTIQHPASGAENDNNDSYWSDTYSSGAFDFIPANVTVVELRVRVHFTSATANKQSGAGPKAQGCWQVGTSTTYYCSNWIENLNGASTQTFTISSSSIRTYVANGDGAAAGSSEWNSLVSNLQSSGENIIVHTWTQGDGDGNSENGDKVAFDEVYAEVYYTGGDFTQHTYRWYVNTDAIQPTDPWPSGTTDLAENTPITTSDNPPTMGDVLRLRMNIKGAMSSGTEAFKLQYGEGPDCSSISTWIDVGGIGSSSIWRGYNNSTPSDGATISSILLSNSTKRGTYEEANNSTNNPETATVNDYTEYDWVIQNNGAVENKTYCFRMVEDDGTVLDVYTNYPKLTTKPSTITQRAYIFENDDGLNVNSNSNIASANTPLTDVLKGQRFVVRFQIDETNNSATGNKTYKLQYDKDGDGQWTDVWMGGGASSNTGGNFGEWNIKTLSASGEPASVGRWTSIAVPPDGKPVISFYNATDGDLAVCKCNDSSCISAPTCNYNVDGSSADVGKFTSMAIGTDGYPVIAHIDDTNDRVRVCKCSNSSCSSASCNNLNNISASYDATNDFGSLDIAVDSSGYPWISFNNTTSGNSLEVCHCNDNACAGQNESCTQVDNINNPGPYSSIALDSSGNPIVGYFRWGTTQLAVAKYVGSGGSGCASGVTDWQCTNIETGGLGISISFLASGTPVITHQTQNVANWGESIRFCKCGNSSCSSGNVCNQVIDLGTHGKSISMVVEKDGLPVISGYFYNDADLYFYKCNDNSCSGGDEFYQKLDSTGSVGQHSSLAITPDGWPVISYWDETNTNLKVAKMIPVSEIQASWGLSGSSGDSLTSAKAGTCYSGTTWQNGVWYEATGESGNINLGANKCTELAFVIDTLRAVPGIQYRLRLVESNGTALDNYSQYPTFTIISESGNTKRYSKFSILRSSSSCNYNSNYYCGFTDSVIGGHHPSLAIGSDGFPIIAFTSIASSDYDLRVCKCGDASCSLGNSCVTVDSTNNVGNYPSIAIGTDGLPIISHFDDTNDDLRVCKCNTNNCSSNTCTTVDSTNNVGYFPSIAIGTDGLPIIAHYDYTNGDLRVCKCGNASCSSSNTCTTVDSTNSVGYFPSIAIGTDGLPIIAHYDYTNGDLRVCKCGNASCSSSNTCTTVDSTNNVGMYTSIAIGTDGYPIISHFDDTNDDLRVCKCNTNNCSSNTCTTVDSTNNVGMYTSIAIGTDGYPIISHFDDTNDSLRVCKCGNASCSSGNSCEAINSSWVGAYSSTSLAIGVDGLPVIAHYYGSGGYFLGIAKGIGLPTTALAFFNKFIKTDNQIKFKSDNSESQFLEHWLLAKDGLLYWLDKTGYDNIIKHDGLRDYITSSANESPIYEFIDKHSSASNNIYVQWTGRSNVSASTNNIKLEIYNWNTNSWELVTTESTCPANNDCVISGSKTTNLSYYYFPRYNFDSTKSEKDTNVEYYTYWRVYQETASGSQTLYTDMWKISYSPIVTFSGNAYENETSTVLSVCDGSTNVISLRVGNTTYGPVPCSSSDGSFTITGITQPSQGDPMILWIDNQTPKATTITKYSGSGNVTGLEIRKDRLMIMSNYGSVTNSDLDTWDSSNDTDIIYNVSSNNLTLADGYKLIVNTGVTYQPGGTITTSPSANSSTTDGDILVQSTATLNMESYPLSIGGDFTNSGTFTLSSGQTTTFTATATGHTISHGTATFENITFNGTGGGWSFASSTTINQDLTMTAGTLSGTQNITVNGGDVTGNGTINLTGGTFTLDGTGNFGGDTNWTFYNLTFGNGTGTETATKTGTNQITITNVLTISSNQTLSAVDDTWVLSGTGTPFVVNGTFNPDWSTVHYTGNGATNIAGVNYATLKIGTSNNANITYTALGNITAYQEVNIQSAGSGYTNTFNMQGYNLVVGDPNYSNSGDIVVPVRAAFVQSASGTTIVRSNWWGAVNNAYLGGAGSTTFYNLQIGYTNDNYPVFAYLAGDITVLNDLTITLAGVNNHILDVTTSNYQITVGGNWTNNDTFTCRQGTVVFNATTTGKTISDGGDPFYDIVFNGSGGGWLYKDGSSTAPNSTTVQAGTATFLNAKTGTVSVTGGTLNVDWYLATHLVDAINTSTNIDTGDNDITISENSSTPYSTVFRYNGGWGSGATSQTTGTDSTGLNPQPENTGAIRIREYTMTNSSQCPGSGCTLYKYNLQVNWQANYGEYDYYQGYGQKYLTSCLSGSSSSCGDDTSADDTIGVDWYRETPSTQNGTKPYDGLNEPPYHGTWYVGMISALEVSISDYDIDFGTIEPGSLPTNQQNTITVQTGASHGYVIYTSTIQQMTHTLYPTVTIPNWTGTNSSPTIWTTGEGFGYSTDDYTLTGGTPDRFSGPKYAGFSQTGPGDPVADRDGPTTSSDGQNTITYRLGVSQTQPAGSYSTTVLFVVVPEY